MKLLYPSYERPPHSLMPQDSTHSLAQDIKPLCAPFPIEVDSYVNSPGIICKGALPSGSLCCEFVDSFNLRRI